MPETIERIVIIAGNFPPEVASSDQTASLLVHRLHSDGNRVITLSEPGRNVGNIDLIYRSKRLFLATLDALPPKAAETFVFTSALVMTNIEKPRLPNRLKEIWRRSFVAFLLGRRAAKVTYVIDAPATTPQFWLVLGAALGSFLTVPFATKIKSPRRLSQQYDLPSISTRDAIDTVFDIAFEGEKITEGVLSPRSLHPLIKALRKARSIDGDLAITLNLIRQLAAETWKVGPHFLRNFREHDGEGTPHTQSIPTDFLGYYQAFIKSNPALPNDIKRNKDRFQDWYLNNSFPQKAYPYLPIPSELIPQPDTHLDAAAALLKFAPRVVDVSFLSPELMDWFVVPISNDPASLSHGELYFALCAELPISLRAYHEQFWTSDEVRDWFYSQICRAAPALLPFSTAQHSREMPPPSANISGVTKGESGLAKNARMSARAFQQLNIPTTLRDFGTLNQVTSHTDVPHPVTLKRTLHLHNINADRIPRQMVSSALSGDNNPLHVGYLLWELNSVPQSHLLAGQMLDEIWTPTEFVRSIYETAFEREVINIGKAIDLPHFKPSASKQNYLFLTSFDVNSSVERKNPLATVQAFLDAFPDDPDVRLLVKATQPGSYSWGDPHDQMDRIKTMAKKDNRIVVDQRMMPYRDYLDMFTRADCIVSSHRAEGFGYVPAYGLFYEKPVIVTDYSGTQDFCNHETAFPVANSLKPAEPGEVIAMAEGAEWAEIDIHDLATQMRYVRDNPDVAATRAKAGRALVQQKYAPEAHAERYRQRLIHLGVIEN